MDQNSEALVSYQFQTDIFDWSDRESNLQTDIIEHSNVHDGKRESEKPVDLQWKPQKHSLWRRRVDNVQQPR